MAKEKRPAMPLYVRDILSDQHFIVMSLAEKGAYMTLIMHCWMDRYIPDDPSQCARLVGCSEEEMRTVWPSIRRRFKRAKKAGLLIHGRVEEERSACQIRHLRRVQSAKIGASKRWPVNDIHANGIGPAMPVTCLSVSSSVSSSVSEEEDKKQFDVFRSVYAQTGKPVNEGDWMAASMEWISAELDEQAEAILAHLNALIGTTWKDNIRNREHQYIPAPVNWLRKRPWTRQPEAIARYQ
ncbi:MAG: DUF1376 domain-containing protein [bacterium]